jgi:plastocyanin
MRPITLVIPVALLSLVTACGGSTTPTATPGTTGPAPTTGAATTTSESPTTGAPAAGGKTLTAEVPVTAPFKITLKDESGATVTTLPAGTYTVIAKDPSAIHNVHLTGPGVEEKTTVPETKDATWTVTFTAGTYTYICDPHPTNMKETFTVT